jgi:pyruvate formate lyase activating enzyme
VPDAQTTFCPDCRRAVIERDIFAVTAFRLTAGKCRFCGTPVAGVWAA